MSDKIRNHIQLQSKLDYELSWRIRELADVRSDIAKNVNLTQSYLLRGGICLLYAHWEGFVKTATSNYASLLTNSGLKYRSIGDNFIGLPAKKHIDQIADIKRRIFTATNLVRKIFEIPDQDIQIDLKPILADVGNLNHELFMEIVRYLGLPEQAYELKDKLIDESLLKRRNEVAHGNYLIIDAKGYMELHDNVLAIIKQVKLDIMEAAISRAYLRPKTQAQHTEMEGQS